MIGKLEARTVEAANRRAIRMIKNAARPTRTVTVDNGTEFHGYKAIEAATGSKFYFATPYHSWERGTSENTNGLIRQYLPKRQSMAHITQRHCSRIAQKLNNRPRKRLDFLTPKECYELNLGLPRVGGRLSACVFSLFPTPRGVRSFRCARGVGE